MSSWGVLLALAGYSYSGPEMRMGFAPKMNADAFKTVWTAGAGWGTYAQTTEAGGGLAIILEAGGGAVDLRELDITLPPSAAGRAVRSVRTWHTGTPAAASVRREGDMIRIILAIPVQVAPGKPLALTIAY
jgi:hypothetical protein